MLRSQLLRCRRLVCAQVQAARQAILKRTEEVGSYTGDDFGWRQSLKGRRFQIHDAVLWNVEVSRWV